MEDIQNILLQYLESTRTCLRSVWTTHTWHIKGIHFKYFLFAFLSCSCHILTVYAEDMFWESS